MLNLVDHLALASCGIVLVFLFSSCLLKFCGRDSVVQYWIQAILVASAALVLPLQIFHAEQVSNRLSVGSLALQPEAVALPADVKSRGDLSSGSDIFGNAFLQHENSDLKSSSKSVAARLGLVTTSGESVTRWLLRIYVAGLLVWISGFLCRLWKTIRLLANSTTVPERCYREHFPTDRRLRFAVRQSADISVPSCLAFPRRIVLLPVDFFEHYSAAQQKCILVHESVHLRRQDWVFCWFQQLMFATYWFHPLAWILYRRLDQCREISCDAVVVRQTRLCRTYAGTLLTSCRQRQADRLFLTSFNSRFTIKRRLEMLSTANRRLSRWTMSAAIASAAASVTALVIFQSALLSAAPPETLFPVSSAAETTAELSVDEEMSAEIRAPRDGRSPQDMLQHFRMGFAHAGITKTPDRIVNNETVVSTRTGCVDGDTITASAFYLNLPEGSEMKARLSGRNLLIQPGEMTGFEIEQGAIEIFGPDGVRRFKAEAVSGRLIASASIQSSEVVFELSAETDQGRSSDVRVKLDLETGIKTFDGDPPHGHVSYSLQQPGGDSDDPIRVKMHWVYDMEQLRSESEGDGQKEIKRFSELLNHR